MPKGGFLQSDRPLAKRDQEKRGCSVFVDTDLSLSLINGHFWPAYSSCQRMILSLRATGEAHPDVTSADERRFGSSPWKRSNRPPIADRTDASESVNGTLANLLISKKKSLHMSVIGQLSGWRLSRILSSTRPKPCECQVWISHE